MVFSISEFVLAHKVPVYSEAAMRQQKRGKMNIYEVSVQIGLLESVSCGKISEAIGEFIRSAIANSADGEREFRFYTFDQPYPLETEKVYFEGKIYTIHIRTVSRMAADFFAAVLPFYTYGAIQGLSSEITMIPRTLLRRVYTLTPIVSSETDQGYWRFRIDTDEYIRRIKKELIAKYNVICNSAFSDDFPLFDEIKFENRKPIQVPYKNSYLFGDKLSLTASMDDLSQELLYMALGTGIGVKNTRGLGFLGYRFHSAWAE